VNVIGPEKQYTGMPPISQFRDGGLPMDILTEESTTYLDPHFEFNCRYRDPQEVADATAATVSPNSISTMLVSYYENVPQQVIESFEVPVQDQSNARSLVIETKAVSKTEDLEASIEPLYRTLQSLSEVYEECSEENWDGYGAQPISHVSYLEAVKLLTWIPPSIPMPEVTPEPGGEIAFEWYQSKDSVFVASVGGHNIITYAGLFGEDSKAHGTESFREKLPQTILDKIRRILP